MSFHDEPGLRPAKDIQTDLKLAWCRQPGVDGVELTASHPDGRLLVIRKIRWTTPGFGNKRQSGWAAFTATTNTPRVGELTQEGAAYSRAVDAQLHIERVTGLHR